jgi:uncharacterized protein YkwD
MQRLSISKYVGWASASLASAMLLAACGGGGGDASPAAGSAPADPSAVSAQPATTATAPSTSAPRPTAAPAGRANGADTSCGIANFQADMLSAINTARATARSCTNGGGGETKPAVAAVAWNDLLFNAAAAHSKDMADRDFFKHDTPEGVNPFQRMLNAGYKLGAGGETIAAGQNGIASVMNAWLKSSGHCNIIMSASYKEVGASCVKNSSGTPYWTMDIASQQ